MSEQAPSKERIHPCPHGHTPDLCRLCMRAEIERLDSALTSSRGETARACQEYREVLAENTKLKRAAHEPSQTSNEKVARLRALFDDRTKDFRRSHSEALFNEYARLERELETANRTIAHFLGPEGEKYIDRFAAMLAGPVSLDESLRRYSPPEPCPNCEKLGQLLATTLDGEDGIIVATGSKGRDEKLFSANDIRVFTAIGFALRKKHEADRATPPPPAVPALSFGQVITDGQIVAVYAGEESAEFKLLRHNIWGVLFEVRREWKMRPTFRPATYDEMRSACPHDWLDAKFCDACRAAQPTTGTVAPIACIRVGEDDTCEVVHLYAPGLPPGEHDVYPVPLNPSGHLAPSMFAEPLCPHGMPLAENICGPCSEGRPNRASQPPLNSLGDDHGKK